MAPKLLWQPSLVFNITFSLGYRTTHVLTSEVIPSSTGHSPFWFGLESTGLLAVFGAITDRKQLIGNSVFTAIDNFQVEHLNLFSLKIRNLGIRRGLESISSLLCLFLFSMELQQWGLGATMWCILGSSYNRCTDIIFNKQNIFLWEKEWENFSRMKKEIRRWMASFF